MPPLYIAKQSDVTEKGSRYVILQDGPASFHITVQRENIAIYDYISNPQSMQILMNTISALESELLQ
jgi:hypothetical protein